MKNTTPFYIEVNLDDYDKIDTPDDLIFAKLGEDDSEYIIDKGLSRLVKYIYDDEDRCIENIIYERTYDFGFEPEDETELVYVYNSTVYHNYLLGQPYPFRSKHGNWWVANKYDKGNKLLQAVASNGATLQHTYHRDNSLAEKKFTILIGEKVKTFTYRFNADNRRYFYEYEDSDGNYWNHEVGFDFPFRHYKKLTTILNNGNDFF
jgi:hypothetical protein